MAGLTAKMIHANNARVRAADPRAANPAPVDGIGWNRAVEHEFAAIRAEWDRFEDAGGKLPRIEQILTEHQGNEGSWRAGLLLSRGRAVRPLADHFPHTVRTLATIPGLLYAIWSLLEPGASLPEHSGPNAGVLRYHITVASNPDTALSVAGTVVPYREGHGILFDDTAPHAAWNRGTTRRVTLLCEILRPVPPPARWLNQATQGLLALDPRYKRATVRAAEWHRVLNPDVPAAGQPAAAATTAG